MKRRYLFGAGILAACGGVVLGLTAILPESGVMKVRFGEVEIGMTEDQVELLFDRPGTVSIPGRFAEGDGVTKWWLRQWKNEDGSLAQVAFDKPCGTVVASGWLDGPGTIGAKLRRWGWPWW
jgi:hypothetical protein